ncbi:hypothetical protein [Streptomyces sp. NPDC055962]|uniref:hypothetical protein n=1 Tax=unclassified Streptomyces TaxID=2593676 RepID=UPI0035DE43C8
MPPTALAGGNSRRRFLLGAAGAFGAGVAGALGVPRSASASASSGAAGRGASVTGTVYIASDSTAQTYSSGHHPQAGWWQELPAYFTSNVTVANRAIGGRSSRSFVEQGRLAAIRVGTRPERFAVEALRSIRSLRTRPA